MNDRTPLWITLAIFAVFMPFAEAINYEIRGWGPFPWPYEVPAILIEYAIMMGVGYAYVRLWQTGLPRWVRVCVVLVEVAAAVLIVESLKWSIGHAVLGRVHETSSFAAITGLVGGSMLAKAYSETPAKDQTAA